MLTCSESQQELVDEYTDRLRLVGRASLLGYSLATSTILLQVPRIYLGYYSLATSTILLQVPRYYLRYSLATSPILFQVPRYYTGVLPGHLLHTAPSAQVLTT